MRVRILIALVMAAVCAESASAATYLPGFVWNRSTDFTGGTIAYGTAGNPNNDSQGNATWYYEGAQGGNLASANPWYAQSRSLLVWSPGTNQWRAGTADQAPEVGQTQMSMNDINFTFASPIVRWQNPTGQSILTNIDFDTDMISFRHDADSYDAELAVVQYHALSNTYDVLWSDTRTLPHNGLIQSGPRIDLANVAIAPGDSVLFTTRVKLDSPLGGNGSIAWFDAAQLTLEPASAVPLPSAAWSGLGLLGVMMGLKRMKRGGQAQRS
jgi:hypothetical protein